jgi:uncharacterized protein
VSTPESALPPVPVSGRAFFWNALLFTRALRSAGVPTDLSGAIDYSRALTLVDIGDREQVRAAGLTIFVRRRDEVPVYDAVFRRFWQGFELAIPGRAPWDGPLEAATEDGPGSRRGGREGEPEPGEGPGTARPGESEATDDGTGPPVTGDSGPLAWSRREQLRTKLFERMSPAELRDAERLVDALRPRLETRLTRRHELHRHGRALAPRQMLRRNLGSGGDLVEWVWRRRSRRPRAIVVICDVSGSMERYSRLLIRFAQALRRSSGVRTEAFVFGTHLTRVTRELSGRDPDIGLERVAQVVTDWSGGTRIGESLRAFNMRWARRVLPSSGVVMIVSDGWDRGDPDVVRREAARLQRSCHRLIWLNPLAGSEHYQPLAAGMAAALPSIDDLVPVHDLASLERLGDLLAEMAVDRGLRPDRSGRPRVHRAPRRSEPGRSAGATIGTRAVPDAQAGRGGVAG